MHYGGDKISFPIAFLSKVLYVGITDHAGHNYFGYSKDNSTLSYIIVAGTSGQLMSVYSLGV